MKFYLVLLLQIFGLYISFSTSAQITTQPVIGQPTTCSTSPFTGSCGLTYNGRVVWQVQSVSSNTVTFQIAFRNATCSGNLVLPSTGTVYIKSVDACGAIIAQTPYSSNTASVTLSTSFTNPGQVNLVAVIVTNNTTPLRYHSLPITVTVPAQTPQTPTLSSPSNGSCIDYYPTQPTFTWNQVSGATSYRFYLSDITNGAPGTSVVPTQFITNGTSYQLPAGNANWLPNRLYAWRVEACNATTCSPSSAVWQVKTKPTFKQATSNSPVYVGATANFYANNIDNGVTYTWTGPASLNSIGAPSLTNVQLSQAGTYTVSVSNGLGCNYTSSTQLQVIAPSTLSVTYPNSSGLSFTIGQNINVTWNYTGAITSNVQIELVKADNSSLSPAYVIGTIGSGEPIANKSKSWVITNVNNNIVPGSQYKIKLYTNSGTTYVDYSDNAFTINSNACVQWDFAPISSDFTDPAESPLAFEYLCNKQIIDQAQLKSAIKTVITRENLAKIAFRGLFTPNINQLTPADNFPVPFIDLQTGAYPREAKVMSYLEYGDGISVFARRFTHFRPKAGIQRRDILKAFMEAFNIKPDWTGYNATNSTTLLAPFTDVYLNDAGYGYINKARQLGIISANVTVFRPADLATREESFLYLYRTMKLIDAGTIIKPNGTLASSYFVPNNLTPFNFARAFQITDASFNNYTKTSFGIAGKVPLAFAHNYNSYITELPDEYQFLEPMGKGWNHNYNTYLRQVEGDDPANDRRFIVYWGDGTMLSFKESGGVFTPESEGVYSKLTRNVVEFYLTTKNQVKYRFSQVAGTTNLWGLISVEDRNTNTLNINWESYTENGQAKGRVKKVFVDATNRYLDFVYNAQHKLSSVTAKTGNISRSIQFTYSADGDLKTYTDPKSQVTTYFYDGAANPATDHLLTRIQLPRGNVITNTYENRKLKSSQVNNQFTANISFTPSYTGIATNTTNTTLQITRGATTLNSSYTANTLGQITNATSPSGSVTVGYDPVQKTRPKTITNNTTNVSAGMTYDGNGNVLTATRIGGSQSITETFTYNSFNDVLTHRNGRNFTTTFGYDAKGNLTSVTDALGNVTNIIVNADGTVQRVTNPEQLYTQFGYNVWGNVTSTSLQGIINSSTTYDDASRVVETANPNNVKTKYSYDFLDQVLEVINDFGGLNQSLKYEYDANGNLVKITNPKNISTNFTYDNDDQLIQYEFGGFTKKYEYNLDGTLKRFTNQRNDVSDFVYNTDGQIADDGYAVYTYDAQKRLSTIRHKQNNRLITYGYDAFNRIKTVTYDDFAGNTVTYDYDNNNNVIKITYPRGFAVGYEYDALDRISRVYNASTNNTFATYEYLKDGRLKKTINGNSTYTNYGYDNVGRLNLIDNRKQDNSVLSTYSFEMDNLGNHTKETANEPLAPPLPVPPLGAVTYAHSTTNRMTQQGTNSFGYDGNGNNSAATGQWTSTYTYDKNDNLLTSTQPALTMEYDALENRRRKNNTRYVLDILGGSNVLMETDLNGNPQAYYIHGLGLIARLDAAQANASYYHYDYRGSTTTITNTAQAVTHKYVYGAFGEMLAAEETGFTNAYRYVGKYGVQYEDSTLYFMRARYYNPKKGRFLGEDPIWNMNLFGYSSSNPINYFDPFGLQEEAVCIGGNLTAGVGGGLEICLVYDSKNFDVVVTPSLSVGAEVGITAKASVDPSRQSVGESRDKIVVTASVGGNAGVVNGGASVSVNEKGSVTVEGAAGAGPVSVSQEVKKDGKTSIGLDAKTNGKAGVGGSVSVSTNISVKGTARKVSEAIDVIGKVLMPLPYD